VLSDADAAAPSLPSKPTHVVITPTDVRQTANASAPVVLQLPPGSQVYLVDTAGDWVLVARDGKKLGYVERTALAKLQ
jgi:Bacterial SH3 domain